MGATILARVSDIAWQMRKAVSATALVLWPDGTTSGNPVTGAPTVSAGAGAPTEAANNGSLYLRTDGNAQFRSSGSWVDVATGTAHAAEWSVIDDLFGKADTEVDHGWILNSGTDGQALDPALDTAQAGGVWQLVTGDADGTTAADGSGMVWADMPIQLDSTGGITTIEARIRIKSAITTVSVGFGLTDSTALEEPFTNATDTITSTATDAVGFLFDSAATTLEWWGCAVDTDTDDAGNAATGVAPTADVWQILRIEISADGATINFFIDNVATAVLALAADAGVGPDVVLYPYLIANATTTTSRTIDVDWVRVNGIR